MKYLSIFFFYIINELFKSIIIIINYNEVSSVRSPILFGKISIALLFKFL